MSTSQPLSYGQAYKKVCPDGNGRNPTDQEQKDILELMRQSGYLSPRDRVGSNLPQKPKTMEDLKDWCELPAAPKMKPLTKHEFLSVKVNRDAYKAHLELHSK
jgi:hypothetical protein